jgi:hypothetical protein
MNKNDFWGGYICFNLYSGLKVALGTRQHPNGYFQGQQIII